MLASCVLVFGVLFLASDVSSYVIDGDQNVHQFTYDVRPNDPYGVYNWPTAYSQSCAGSLQSPLNIKTRYTRYNPTLPCPVKFNRFTVGGQLKNNGQSVQFTAYSPRRLTLTNIPYRRGNYELSQFHIHYGGHVSRVTGRKAAYGTLKPGSEHRVNGYQYSGEVHLVFQNVLHGTRDTNPNSDLNQLLVMSVFVKALPRRYVRDRRFSRYISEKVQTTKRINDTLTTTVDTSMFFGPSCEYYTYPGSKTTPSCSENVRWIVMRNPIYVTKEARFYRVIYQRQSVQTKIKQHYGSFLILVYSWYTLSNIRSRGNYIWYYGNFRNNQAYNGRMVETNARRNG